MNLLGFAFATVIALGAPAALATTFSFSGTVTDGLGEINVGDTISGSFSYSASAPNAFGFAVSPTQFVTLSPVTALSVDGRYSLSNPDGEGEIQIDNDFAFALGDQPNDRFLLRTFADQGLVDFGLQVGPGFTLTAFNIRLDDSTAAAFGDGTLPLALALADFDSAVFFIDYQDAEGTGFGVSGTLTSLSTVAAVPLPASLPFLIAGLAALGLTARRRTA